MPTFRDEAIYVDHVLPDIDVGAPAVDDLRRALVEIDLLSCGSWNRELRSNGRCAPSRERSAVRAAYSDTRADRFADRIDANVAAARTSVPAAVASEAQVDQFVMLPQLNEARIGTAHLGRKSQRLL